MTKAANEVDRHVGGRVRMRRMMIGLSQEKLGGALGVTFQQVQKYEKGTNRISVSRLRQIADALGVTIEYLYEGAEGGTAASTGFAEDGAPYESEVLTNEALKLLRAFHGIQDPAVRRKLIELAAAMSGAASDGDGERSE